MTDRRGMKLADYVRELTEPHSHVETYLTKSITGPGFVDARHVTQQPSLLTQLWANDVPSAAAETGSRPGFASKPAARLDALDTAVRIDIEAHRWVTDLGEQARTTDTQQVIRQLHSLLPSADVVTRRAVEHDVRRWWIRARIATGWDSPAWKPDATCPQCGERGTLKVRLAEHLASCTNDGCGVAWDEATIGLLADHIRAESAERHRRDPVGACSVADPDLELEDLRFLCPACGSARCHRALAMRLLADLRAARADGRIGA